MVSSLFTPTNPNPKSVPMTWLHKRFTHSKWSHLHLFSLDIFFPCGCEINIFCTGRKHKHNEREREPEEKPNIKSINRVWNILGDFFPGSQCNLVLANNNNHCLSSSSHLEINFRGIRPNGDFFALRLFLRKCETKPTPNEQRRKKMLISLHQHPQYSMRVHWYCGARRSHEPFTFAHQIFRVQ